MYLAAIGSGLIGGHYVRQFGALRLSQVAMLLLVVGLLLAAAASEFTVALTLATLCIGIGYGLTNPTSAQLLSQHGSKKHRGLIFSIKQTGVPMGVALAGLLIPIFLSWFSWRGSMVAIGMVIGCELVFLAIYRKHFDHGLQAVKLNWTALLVHPLKRVFSDPPLRSLAICSGVYSGIQVCFLTFMVSDLKIERGFSLAAAAGALATAQITSIAARPFWGAIADRYIEPRRLLGFLGIAIAAMLALFGLLPKDASYVLVMVAAMLVAATAVGWNGVFFAGVAQHVPSHEIAMVTGGTQFVTFGGAMLCPLLFAAAVTQLHSYSLTFLWFSLGPLAMGLWLLISHKQHFFR
jgi:MFS family permease